MDNITTDTVEGPEHESSVSLLEIVAQLTLEDIGTIQSFQEGSDLEFALRLQQEEAESLWTFTQDYHIARSLEQIDREAAVALSEASGSRSPSPASSPQDCPADDTSELQDSDFDDLYDEPASLGQPSNSSTSAPSMFGRILHNQECTICAARIRGPLIRAPCGHFYDQNCLVNLFRSTVTDESLYPPRCCQRPFDVSEIQIYLGSALLALFQKKAIEFGTADRVYCHRRECSAFLGSATMEASSLLCPECSSETCARCKAAIHPLEEPCDPFLSAEDEVILEVATQNGWIRCPGCRQLVELTHGCYHMTCRCSAQFCYLCAAKWKTCDCVQWEKDRLVTAAEDRVQRQLGDLEAEIAEPDYRRMVEEEVVLLREDHDCVHTWIFRSGGGTCEHCGDIKPWYLLRCTGCQTLACVPCQRNRL